MLCITILHRITINSINANGVMNYTTIKKANFDDYMNWAEEIFLFCPFLFIYNLCKKSYLNSRKIFCGELLTNEQSRKCKTVLSLSLFHF